jgi:hypothetical protein
LAKSRVWTAPELALLAELYEAGDDAHDCALVLCRREGEVRAKLREMKQPIRDAASAAKV